MNSLQTTKQIDTNISEDIVEFNISIQDMDLSFIEDMIKSGISDDTSALVGDVSFEDKTIYDEKNISDQEANDYLKSLNLPPLF